MPRGPLLFFILASSASGAAITAPETEFFEKSVRPVLAEHCVKCHGPEKQKSDLRLDSREALLKGSENGPVVVLGNPGESTLIKSVKHEGDSKMPEKEPKLPDTEIAALSEWVKMGAPWPEGGPVKPAAQQEARAKHWSFQPVRDPQPPVPKDESHWCSSPLDQFILAKLEAAGLAPAARANRRSLLRRATYDLTGLPPTPAEVEDFENDQTPDAFSRVIDRLLASPRYGERWGRYWLDVARYADTKGYLAGNEERRFPYSYTYRDWVIQALNDDLPYDQFLIQQIAADRAPTKTDPESLAALGFLTLGRRFLNNEPDIIDDRIDVICRGAMALTAGCARCHDHKFDPISQKDYYALYGVLASSMEPKSLPPLRDTRDAQTAAAYANELKAHQEEIRQYEEKKQGELAWLLSLSIHTPLALPASVVRHSFNRADRDEFVRLQAKIDALNAGPLAGPRAMALVDKPEPVTPHVFIRGNPSRLGEEVPRRFFTVLSAGDPKPFQEGSGRLELAQAIASKSNPLTARVIVNRVWLHHFAAGIVRTPSDFGVKGEAPTHPELLDWLATRFTENGWSLKKLHRMIMLSSAYQQGSDVSPDAFRLDPENRLVSRMNRQRLDFEALWDSLLLASGKLDLRERGRGVELMQAAYPTRRAVYGFIDRQNLPGTFRTFDFASPDATSARRHVTTVPQQALFMMNSPFVIEQARALASDPKLCSLPPSETNIQALYRKLFSRKADPSEVDAALHFLQTQAANADQAAQELANSAWQYGWGVYDAAKHTVDFHIFAHEVKGRLQPAEILPDPTFNFASLTAAGGHPGNPQHPVVRRWTAPADGTVRITGTLKRPDEHGDGVEALIVSSRAGELGRYIADPKAPMADTAIPSVAVQRGDTIDFVLQCRGDDSFDSFEWAPVIGGENKYWDSKEAFGAGAKPPGRPMLTPWEKYAQVLLSSNEFIFID